MYAFPFVGTDSRAHVTFSLLSMLLLEICNAPIYNLNLPGPPVESTALYKYVMNPGRVSVLLVTLAPEALFDANLSRGNIDSSEVSRFKEQPPSILLRN